MPTEQRRPLLSFDLDGVLARPPFGLNFSTQRDLHVPAAAAGAGAPRDPDIAPGLLDRLLIHSYYRLRFLGRAPMPGAAEALAAAREHYRVIVLSGRNWRGRTPTEAWLKRHGLLFFLDQVVLNDTPLPPTQFKLAAAQQLQVRRHVDDDSAVAVLLARHGVAVDLIDWPRNRGLTYPLGVTRHTTPAALAAALRAEPPLPSATPPP